MPDLLINTLLLEFFKQALLIILSLGGAFLSGIILTSVFRNLFHATLLYRGRHRP